MSLTAVTDRPERVLGILSTQAKELADVIANIDQTIIEHNEAAGHLTTQKLGLMLVAQAIENDMDRIRSKPVPEEEQLELKFDA